MSGQVGAGIAKRMVVCGNDRFSLPWDLHAERQRAVRTDQGELEAMESADPFWGEVRQSGRLISMNVDRNSLDSPAAAAADCAW